jgi:hypothetical protein
MIGQIVNTVNSSIEKRCQNKEAREKREAKEKAAKEKADAAIRTAILLTSVRTLLLSE